MIRIANGQGFWGDSIDAPKKLIRYGKIDYLTLDYLAEVTMSIMQKQKIRNPNSGYARDFVALIDEMIPEILSNNIKVISNAGGVNSSSCSEEILRLTKGIDGHSVPVGIIEGDDILDRVDSLYKSGVDFKNMDTGESFEKIRDKIYSANAYISSFSIRDALQGGAKIVLAGRVSDPGLALGPMLYEYNWKETDYNLLAAGTLAGHITECGAQCTGGNFTRWDKVVDLANIGYPIIESYQDGSFAITKPEDSGGIVNRYTVAEQILYELGNPENYISPDVCVDFTSFTMKEDSGKVCIDKVTGMSPTNTYKVAISYFAGYKASGQLTISGPDALEKAKLVDSMLWDRLRASGNTYKNKNTEFLGLSSCHQNLSVEPDVMNEVVVRWSVRDDDKVKVDRFGMELAPLITSGPPGVTGFSGGRPKATEVVGYWPCLIDKSLVPVTTRVVGV